MSFFKLLIGLIALGTVISCRTQIKYKSAQEYYWLEKHRKLFIEELRTTGKKPHGLDSLIYTKYVIPDSIIAKGGEVLDYIQANLYLPDYIIKALIERKVVISMTMGELFLVKPGLRKKLSIGIPKHSRYSVFLGYETFYFERTGMFNGPVWVFKDGFLLEFGIV